MSFQDLADIRRIAVPKALLDQLAWDVSPDPYQRMAVEGEVDVEALLRLFARRGLDPALVAVLLANYPARPLERALIAYDVLRGALLGPADDTLATQLATEAAPLHGIATAQAAVPRDRIPNLIESFGRDNDHLARARRRADTSTLPSLAGLALDSTSLTADDPLFAHVRLLAKAHLPSLAIAYLQVAYDRFELPLARELLVELGLDHDLLDSVPQIRETDPAAMQLQAYLLVRASLAQFDVDGAAQILATMQQHPGVAGATNLSLILVEAQLAIMQGQQLDDDGRKTIASIAEAGPGWRYAALVRLASDPEILASTLDSYLVKFGNDPWLWAQALTDQATRPVLARELRYGSHDPAVWRAVGMALGDTAIDNQVTERLFAQLRPFAPTLN